MGGKVPEIEIDYSPPIPKWVISHIKLLTERKFYGKLTLSFESGKVTTCKQEETIKPNL